MSSSLHEEPITKSIITSEKKIPSSDNQSGISKDNFFHKLDSELEIHHNDIYQKFMNYKKLDIEKPNSINNAIIDSKYLTIFIEILETIKKKLGENFKNLLIYEKKIKDQLSKNEILRSKLVCLQELESIVSKKNSISLKKTIKDISDEILDSNITDDLRRYYTFYDQHILHIKNYSKINCLNNIPLCSVCINGNISHTCVPCGHTYCENCINKISCCSICRQDIKTKQKIYII